MTTAAYLKEIVYDRETRDYAMYLDGELVGFARTYHEAEVTLDQLVFDRLHEGQFATATELDGGAEPAELGDDEPGHDCPDHGPYADDDGCPKCRAIDPDDSPLPPPWDGKAIARAFHRDYNRFIAAVAKLSVPQRALYAISYAGYLSHLSLTRRPVKATDVYGFWMNAITGYRHRAPLTRAYLAQQLAEQAERRGDRTGAAKLLALA